MLERQNTVKLTSIAQGAAVVAVAAIALTACSSNNNSSGGATSAATTTAPSVDYSSLSGTITAGGSSAQGNAEAAWITAFQAQAKGVTINYDKSQGSGGGVTNFLNGSYDFAGSDSPLKAEQTTQAATTCAPGGAIDLPIYLDGVALIYNVSGASKLNLSAATIAKIFNLQITDWSDPAITADNGGTALPAGPITTVARSDGSGTTQNFTNFLTGMAASDWPYPAANSWPVEGNVSKQQGGSAVASTVDSTAGAIGYVDHSATNGLKSAKVASVNGIAFTPEAAGASLTDGAVPAPNGVQGDLSLKFDYAKLQASKSAYPIPLVSYAILCTQFKNATQGKLTTAYLGFVASDAGQQVAAKNAGSAPLPAATLSDIQKSLALVK